MTAFVPIFIPYDETEKQPFESVIKVSRNSFDNLKSAVLKTLKDAGYNNPVFCKSVFYEERKTPSFLAFMYSWVVTFFAGLTLFLFYFSPCSTTEIAMLLVFYPLSISFVIAILHFLICPLKEIEVLQLHNTEDFCYLSIRTHTKAYNLMLFDSIKKNLKMKEQKEVDNDG